MSYSALWCKSNYSFLEGASHPDELVEQAHALGLRALALTDRDGVAGIVRAHVKARELDFKLVVGSELTIDDGSTIVLLARDRGGYANLCRLASAGRLRSRKGASRVAWSEVVEHADGLLALLGGERSPIAREEQADSPTRAWLEELRARFGEHLFCMLTRHRRAEEPTIERRVRARAAALSIPLVAANEVLYHRSERRRVQDVLCAVRHGVALTRAGRLLKPNAEHDLKPAHEFEALFRDDPRSVERIHDVIDRCEFRMSDLRYRYPLERLPDGQNASQWLRSRVMEGARQRYGALGRACVPEDVAAQIAKELAVIDALDYGGYFLTMHEIVEYCRGANILCQGRGSAANSVVCYCLGITAVDPVRMGLLFERFLSLERAEPPDIDLDIEHERREEVIQHVYAKYGRDRAAMVANVIRYRARSALRDVGKALGFSESDLLRASRLSSSWTGVEAKRLAESGLDRRSRAFELLLELAGEIEGFPRHLSIHPGGFVLGHEPIASLVPIENATMRDRTVIQWDKDDVDALGIFKVDLLALGALTHLHKSFDLLRARGLDVSLATIPPDDASTFDWMCRADTVGVFQIESRAQMAMLPRLRPRNYYDLVIEISIVRPGPIAGGLVHPYLRRRNGEEPLSYPHPSLEAVLAKTLGVPLFQEQVMRLAVVAADYTPGEADQLRRDMAAWRKVGRIEQHRARLVTRMQAKGIALDFAERVFQQIRGFGEYGFPESHAASFALISYAGGWLRAHHIVEFTCGLLNSLPMGFYSAATILEDAKRHGVAFLPADVVFSDWECTIEQGAIRMGLCFVKRVSHGDASRVMEQRAQAPFRSLRDFQRRVELHADVLESLSAAGAFDSLSEGRRAALWDARALADGSRVPLFADPVDAPPRFEPLNEREAIGWDLESSQHSTRGHPLAPLRAKLAAQGLPDARAVAAMPDGEVVRFAGVAICRQRPETAAGILFITLEDETGFVNLVVRPNVLESHSVLARTHDFVGVSGRVERRGSIVHVIAQSFFEPAISDEACGQPATKCRSWR